MVCCACVSIRGKILREMPRACNAWTTFRHEIVFQKGQREEPEDGAVLASEVFFFRMI
jgi:hypothetical protein